MAEELRCGLGAPHSRFMRPVSVLLFLPLSRGEVCQVTQALAGCQTLHLDVAQIWRRGGPQGGAQHGCSCSGLCYLESVLSRVMLLGVTNPEASPVNLTLDLFLAVVERGEEKPA